MSDYGPALDADDGGVVVRLRLVPRASATALAGLLGERVKLRVAAPPLEGRANDEACAYLAKVLGVRAREVTLVSGARSRSKVVRVEGLDRATVAARLAAAD